jgi:hypothetical protein
VIHNEPTISQCPMRFNELLRTARTVLPLPRCQQEVHTSLVANIFFTISPYTFRTEYNTRTCIFKQRECKDYILIRSVVLMCWQPCVPMQMSLPYKLIIQPDRHKENGGHFVVIVIQTWNIINACVVLLMNGRNFFFSF